MAYTPNRFPGRCSCGCDVPAGAGIVRRVRGAWITVCADCAGLWRGVDGMRVNAARVVSVSREYDMGDRLETYRVDVACADHGGFGGIGRESAYALARECGLTVEE